MSTFVHVRDLIRKNFEGFKNHFVIEMEPTPENDEVNGFRNKAWATYINAFTPETRQANNCSCCRSFIRQYSGIVSIDNGIVKTIWDIDLSKVDEEYHNAVLAMQNFIKSKSVDTIFVVAENVRMLGQEKSADSKLNKLWYHYSIMSPASLRVSYPEQIAGDFRTKVGVFVRSLSELSIDTVETAIELIKQGSVLRGEEQLGKLEKFLELLKKVKEMNLTGDKLRLFCLENYDRYRHIADIRNHATGTFLVNIEEGMPIDDAVNAFARVMNPHNYKMVQNVGMTARQKEEFRNEFNAQGYTDSLERRLGVLSDIPANELLFTRTSTKVKDIFDELDENKKVNPKDFKKVEELTIDQFMTNVLPSATKLRMLVENTHWNNFVSLTAPENPNSKSFLKWENNIAWCYSKGLADSTITNNVKKAGGKIDSLLRFSIQWNEKGNEIADLDAHCRFGQYDHIYYGGKVVNKHNVAGNLDVDMIRPTGVGVENIVFTKLSPDKYRFSVDPYDPRNNKGVRCEIAFNGNLYSYAYNERFTRSIDIATVTVKDNGNMEIQHHIPCTENGIYSQTKWNIETMKFHDVTRFFLSPNFWNGNQIGNKHYIFSLENCTPDEELRGFFNEQVRGDLEKYKRGMEALARKLKLNTDTTSSTAGLGFSSTIRNSCYFEVTGKTKRIIKVNF